VSGGIRPLAGWVVSLDLWGTLITEGDRAAEAAWRVDEFTRVLEEFGHPLGSTEIQAAISDERTSALQHQRETGSQPNAAGQIANILTALGLPRQDAGLLAVLEVVHTHAVLRACPLPVDGAFDALTAIRDAGPSRLVLTSNTLSTPPALHRELLADLELSEHFDDLLFSADLGIAKPRPEIFHTAAERAGVPEARVVHVGDDRLTDVQGAIDAGCRAVYYNPKGHPVPPHVIAITALRELPEALVALCGENNPA
jgi:putative hydrolase of the HAD superfamily